MSSFSDRLVEARKKQKLTQKLLAEMLGIGTTRLNYWEKGKREPDIEMIKQIAKLLNVDANYLIGLEEETIPEVLSPHEKSVITAYREQPEMQPAVDRILNITKICRRRNSKNTY